MSAAISKVIENTQRVNVIDQSTNEPMSVVINSTGIVTKKISDDITIWEIGLT